MSDFFSAINDQLGIHPASEGLAAAEFTGTIDTGSYILNAAFSGSLYGGVPNNRITGFAGEQATGKTFFVIGIIRQWLVDNPNGFVYYFDSEAAVSNEMLESRGVDSKRVGIREPSTIQEFRHLALQILEKYEEKKMKEKPPMLFVLDSLGMLSTTKEMEDSAKGAETRDMTKSQVIKAAFRVLTLRCASNKVPLLVTNHTYDVVGAYVPMKEISGGSGFKYAASTIATLTKKKDRDDKTREVKGNLITVTMWKSRLSRENKQVEVLLSYTKGLDRYYGLQNLALKYGIFKKLAMGIEINGKRVFEKELIANPEKYYTDDVMKLLEDAANKEFSYGSSENEEVVDEETGEVFTTDNSD